MFAKLAAPRFMEDIRPLLSPDQARILTDAALREAFIAVFSKLIAICRGIPVSLATDRFQWIDIGGPSPGDKTGRQSRRQG